jgi:NAD(P)H-dependent FMN reductase
VNITLISGSHRKNSQSLKVAEFVKNRLSELHQVHEVNILDLAGNPLPLWSEDVWAKSQEHTNLWAPISHRLAASHAFVTIAPEWGGMVTPGLKNLFLLCDNAELSHKPMMLIGISAGNGGAFPISELRMSSYKNTQICFIPDHIIIRKVSGQLNMTQAELDPEEDKLRKRIDYSVNVLLQYAKALQAVRESGCLDLKTYQYGMS